MSMVSMAKAKAAFLLFATTSLSFGVQGCAEDGMGGDDGGPAGGKADEADELDPSDFKCQQVRNESEREGNVLEQLRDPMADMLKLSGCATGLRDLVKRLEETDNQNCSITTFVVTEHGQVTFSERNEWQPRGDALRTVTTRRCNGRQDFELVTSVFGNDQGQLGDDVEVIAFDRDKKEFNYYEAGRSGVTFFGSSTDIMGGTAGRCAGCHTGGGLIMKETRNPWIHWESGAVTPGADKLVADNAALLGRKSGGASMETVVVQSHRPWMETRVRLMTDRDGQFTPEDMLRPLFCTTEINTDTAGLSAGSAPDHLPENALADCRLYGSCSSTHTGENAGPRFSADAYKAAAAAVGQRVTGTGKDDTIFGFAFAEPSVGEIEYVQQLVKGGMLDEDIVTDILAVELTKPVFSDLRCRILDEIDLGWDDIEAGPPGEDGRPTVVAANVRAGLMKAIEEVGSPSPAAAQLLANLRAENNAAEHKAAADAYINACIERAKTDAAAYLADVFRFAAFHRARALALPVMEDKAALMARLDLPTSEKFWDPATCALVDAPVFPAASQPEEPEEPEEPQGDDTGDDTGGDTGDDTGGDTGGEENQCADRCGTDLEFDANASCQCDPGCMDQNPPDCCPGMICE